MVRLPPPIWGVIYLVVTGVVSAAFPWRGLVDLQFVPLGIVLIVLGLAMSIWAARTFAAVGTELNPTSESNKALVVKGPFRWSRNPMYLGITVVSLGIAFWVGSLPMFAAPVLLFATANWVHIPYEEAKMRRQFAGAYDDFTHKVRRWI